MREGVSVGPLIWSIDLGKKINGPMDQKVRRGDELPGVRGGPVVGADPGLTWWGLPWWGPDMAGNPDARTGLAKARLAYIYGIGSPDPGIPVRSRKWLLEVSTVDSKTLDGHLKTWEAELEEIGKSATVNPLGFGLREDVINQHREDVLFLRRQADQLKSEVDNVDEIQSSLYDLIESVRDNLSLTSNDFDAVSRLIEGYLAKSMNRQKLLSLFLTVQNRWQDSSTVSSTISAYEVTLKEQAKRRAKQAGETDAGRDVTPTDGAGLATGNTEVFRR